MRVQQQNNLTRNIKRAGMIVALLAIIPLFWWLTFRAISQAVCQNVKVDPRAYSDLACFETGVEL